MVTNEMYLGAGIVLFNAIVDIWV